VNDCVNISRFLTTRATAKIIKTKSNKNLNAPFSHATFLRLRLPFLLRCPLPESCLAWRCGNGVGHIEKVKLRRPRLALGLVTTFGVYIIPVPGQSGPTQPGRPSLVGAMKTGNGFGHRWGRNDEFCLTVGPATRTVGILAEAGYRCWLLI